MTTSFAQCLGPFSTLSCVLLLATRGLYAQAISGKITAKSDGAPVSGAIVALLDSSGRVVATRLAEDGGTFLLAAPAAGRYSVRAERVGFRAITSAAVLVRQSETIDMPIAIASEGVSLKAVMVNADRRCLVRPQEGLATAQLWNEARKALRSTELTQLAQAAARARHDPHRFAVRVRKFTRDLEPRTLESVHDEQYELEGETITPFVSHDPEVLAREGYMTGNLETGSTYFAPDAAILLSDRFLDSHCFRTQAPDKDRRDDLIGLAFEPVRLTTDARPDRVEIRGVLWLDRATAELRYMEYGYVNLPFEATARNAGGLVEFRPLPDGRWIVWRWYIRMPRLERDRTVDPLLPGRTDGRIRISRVREEGAEVMAVMPPGTRRTAHATVRGTIVDSLRGEPMSGVHVFLSGTSFAASTDSAGKYFIDAVPPGKYLASVVTPRLDSLLLDPPSREFTLSAGEERRVDFGVPTLHTLSEELCPSALADTSSLILGVVRDSGAKAAPGVIVSAEWTEILRAGADRMRVRPITNETFTVRGGRYALCGLPAETRLTIRARRGKDNVAGPQLRVLPGEVRRLDFTLRTP
jgi:hypothetical protein